MFKLSEIVLSWWQRALVLLACGAAIYLLGQLEGERVAGLEHTRYVQAQAAQGTRIVRAQSQVIVKTDVQYRDRIHTIYIKGETIEKAIPALVTPADNERFGVNVGFVRSFNAAWANEPAGPDAESDREPATLPLAAIADAEAFNATACYAWREKAITLRELYNDMKHVMDQRGTGKVEP